MSVDDPLAAPPAPPQVRRLYFVGTGGTLFGLHVVNILLILLTLGVYYFWAKVRVRRYLWGQTELLGDRFAFHGTGRELLLGWLKAALVFGLPAFLLAAGPALAGTGAVVRLLAALLLYVLIFVFVPVAMVGARRYRLSRTSWRGIRFSFRGRAPEFVRLFVRDSLLTLLTFGLYYPYFEVNRQAFMVSHAYFGNRRFGFDGRGRDLFTPYFFMLLLAIPTLGLIWFWYAARRQRYLWDHTTFGEVRFHSTVTGRAMFWLRLVNLGLLVLTLGLAWPWVTVRTARFALRYLSLEGPLDVEAIQQEAQLATATGEGLAGFLDVGFDLG
jgi:uncharacterized membrane protein YjgN (DUF898 family)